MENKNKMTIVELIAETLALVTSLNYTKDTIRHHRNVWSRLEKYCSTNNIVYFSTDVGLTFLKNYYEIDRYDITLSSHRQNIRRSILMLIDYYLHGSVFKSHPYKPHEYPAEFSEAMNLFIDEHVKRFLASRAESQFRSTLERLSVFLVNNKVSSLSDMNIFHVETFVKTYAKFARATISHAMYMLRTFLQFAYEKKYTTKNLALYVPKIKVPARATIPSIYTKDELNRLLSCVDTSTPIGKRDNAMILLGVRYGIRSCDIKALKLSDLHWDRNTIEFVQSKTGNKISHTILPDVGWALIEYLKNGRPKCTKSDNIFVCHSAPYYPFARTSGLARVVNQYFREAKIFCRDNQVKGFHSLRHSLASNLLENEVPIHEIANILGHSTIESTTVYTKIDIKQLATCALEVSADE